MSLQSICLARTAWSRDAWASRMLAAKGVRISLKQPVSFFCETALIVENSAWRHEGCHAARDTAGHLQAKPWHRSVGPLLRKHRIGCLQKDL